VNRVVLTNLTREVSREEAVNSERAIGEALFVDFPNLQFAGFIHPVNDGRRSANWIVPSEDVTTFKSFVKNLAVASYKISFYENGTTLHGGQCEVRTV
jgi:hypothetical protein